MLLMRESAPGLDQRGSKDEGAAHHGHSERAAQLKGVICSGGILDRGRVHCTGPKILLIVGFYHLAAGIFIIVFMAVGRHPSGRAAS